MLIAVQPTEHYQTIEKEFCHFLPDCPLITEKKHYPFSIFPGNPVQVFKLHFKEFNHI